MSDQSPLVSVIITTYNRPLYLQLTINSVKNQTYENIEIIVVDDGTIGADNYNLCATFEDVFYIKIENSGGPARPRNVGIRLAKGEFIAFLDDDDIWIVDKIKIQVKTLVDNPDFGLVHSPCQIIDANGALLNKIVGKSFSWRNKHGDISLNMMGNFTLMMPTPLLTREIINRVGFFNESMYPAGEDTEFWTRCSFITKFYYLDTSLAYYRVHEGSISNQNKQYIDLPLYLKLVLKNQFIIGNINKQQYVLVLNQLCRMQIRTLKSYFLRSTYNLFIIDFFWVFKTRRIKKIFRFGSI